MSLFVSGAHLCCYFINCYLCILLIFWKMTVSPILCSENFLCYEFIAFVLFSEVKQFWFSLPDLDACLSLFPGISIFMLVFFCLCDGYD